MKTLPNDSKMRYHYPISSGCLSYFPAALAGVSKHSYIGGAKYNDGALVHLRYISTEHLDCIGRHLLDLQDLLAAQKRGVADVATYIYDFEQKQDVLRTIPIEEAILIECNALSWRALAFSQEQHEKLAGKPLAPAARLEPLRTEPVTFKLLSFGKNKVAIVKCIRAVMGSTLKDSVDILSQLPYDIELRNSKYTLEQAKALFVSEGATVA